MRTTILAAILAMLTVSCGGKQQPDEPTEEKIAIALTRDGLQPFPEGEVTEASLTEAFAGYGIAASENGMQFAIRDGGNTIVHVDRSGEAVRAKVTDESVAGPAGIRVGADWAKVADLADVQCRRGASPWTDQAFCTSEDLPGIVFAFDIEGVSTPGCVEACRIEDLSAMGGTSVRSIDWSREP